MLGFGFRSPPTYENLRCCNQQSGLNLNSDSERQITRGALYAAFAYLLWGLFPVYFKAVAHVPALEVLAHRMLWSLLFVGLLLAVMRRWSWLAQVADARVLLRFFASAIAVSANWGIYIWAVAAGHIVDASLGYFINPLVNVLIGTLFFAERMRPAQWTAVALAALGVAWLTWQAGELPWIGLSLAALFAAYGWLRKTASLGAIEGLALETALLTPLALAYLIWLAFSGSSAFVSGSIGTEALLMLAGPVTALPLLFFAAGARRIPFSMLGMIQYIAPTLQLLIGVWLYHEPFAAEKAAGYVLIWIALAVFTVEAWLRMRAESIATITPGAA